MIRYKPKTSKKSVSELRVIFQGSTPFLALLGLCRIIGISTLNFGPFSTKLGETVRAGLDNRIYLMDIIVDNAEIWWKVSQWWFTYSPSVPNHLARVFNRPPLAAKVHLNSTIVPRCFPKLVLCAVLPLAGWDDVNLWVKVVSCQPAFIQSHLILRLVCMQRARMRGSWKNHR